MESTIKSQLNYNLLQNIYYQDRVGNKEGYIKYYRNNTDEHEDTKWEIVKYLKQGLYDVYTECRFRDTRGRADIVAIRNGSGYIIEVVNTETEKSIEEKKKKYPQEFKLIVVNSKRFKKEEFKI